MAVQIDGAYEGNLKVRLTHAPSGAQIVTAAPVDNQGDGSSFSPTDLCATALGTCMVTVMGIFAREVGIPYEGITFSLEKHMAAGPRRIARIPVTVNMPAGLTPEQRKKLERVALTCPVYLSLHPEVEKPITFVYPD